MTTDSPSGADLNLDPKELQKFAELSHSWWDPHGESRALHDINACRGEFVAAAPLRGKTVVDVGCGGGILSEFLAQRGALVTGIDASAELIEVANQHAKKNQLDIDYQVSTVETFANSAAQKFDVVTCMELLEHVPNPASVVSACAALAKPEGRVYFSTLNRTPKSYLFSILAAEYLLRLLPKGTHEYRNFIRPSELAGWCRSSNLSLIRSRGISYNPFNSSATLTTALDVNYIVETTPLLTHVR